MAASPGPSQAIAENRSHRPGVVCEEWARSNGWCPPEERGDDEALRAEYLRLRRTHAIYALALKLACSAPAKKQSRDSLMDGFIKIATKRIEEREALGARGG